MKKNRLFDTKGFMLVETLLVSLTISGILIYMYAQFSTINNSYQRLYQYNTADSLYRAGALSRFLVIYTNESWSLYRGLTAKVISCDDIENTSDESYCNAIYEAMNVDTAILTVDNFNDNDVLSTIRDAETKVKLQKFLKTVTKDSSSSKKRLIVLFNDETIATVLFNI